MPPHRSFAVNIAAELEVPSPCTVPRVTSTRSGSAILKMANRRLEEPVFRTRIASAIAPLQANRVVFERGIKPALDRRVHQTLVHQPPLPRLCPPPPRNSAGLDQ